MYYSQMPRMSPQVDENGEAVLDEVGEQVMVPNEARASWLDATTLTTALGLGIVAYALSAFAMVIGLTLMVIDTCSCRSTRRLSSSRRRPSGLGRAPQKRPDLRASLSAAQPERHRGRLHAGNGGRP